MILRPHFKYLAIFLIFQIWLSGHWHMFLWCDKLITQICCCFTWTLSSCCSASFFLSLSHTPMLFAALPHCLLWQHVSAACGLHSWVCQCVFACMYVWICVCLIGGEPCAFAASQNMGLLCEEQSVSVICRWMTHTCGSTHTHQCKALLVVPCGWHVVLYGYQL